MRHYLRTLLVIILFGAQMLAACSNNPPQIADEIFKDVGERGQTIDGSHGHHIVVFEEQHDSRAGQVEIAIMLNRLYHEYGLRDLALEGATMERGDPSAAWFHRLPDPVTRREIALLLLKEGEVSAAEFMAMVYPDFQLHAIEDESQYSIALTSADERAFNRAIQDYWDAFQKATMTDAQHQQGITLFRTLQDSSLDACAESATFNGLIILVDDIGAQIASADKQAILTEQAFYAAACQRSPTMVKNTIPLAKEKPLIAMNIGAGHTDAVIDLLKQQDVSITVLAPLSLRHPTKGSLSEPQFTRKLLGQSVQDAGSLGSLVDGRRKPRPVIDLDWFQSDVYIRFTGIIMARAAAQNSQLPFGLDPAKLGLDGGNVPIQIDRSKIEVQKYSGYAPKVIIPITVASTGAHIWLGAQQVKSETPVQSLEQALDAILKDIKDGTHPSGPCFVGQASILGPTSTPLSTPNSEPTSTPSPTPTLQSSASVPGCADLTFDVKAVAANEKIDVLNS